MEKCPHFLENHPGSCLMLGKNHLESCLISGICVPSCSCIWLRSLSCWTPPEMEYWARWTICMLWYSCYLTAKQFKGRNIIVFEDGQKLIAVPLLLHIFPGIVLIPYKPLGMGKIQGVGGTQSCTEQERLPWLSGHTECIKLWEWNFLVRCEFSTVIQGTDLCNVFMCSNVPGSWRGAGSVCVFPRPRADIQKKGKSAPLIIQTGVLWAQNSSQEVNVCKKQHHGIFLHCQLGLCCVPAQLLLQAWACSVKL